MAGSKFFKVLYVPPSPRPTEERKLDHETAIPGLSSEHAEIQAGRCVSCDSPGCNSGCPVGQDIPSMLKAVEYGDWLKAHQIASKSPLYGLFGQICPQDEGLCQTNCTVAKVTSFGLSPTALPLSPIQDTIAIGPVERAVWDHALKGWLKYPTPKQESGKSVAIIGAGPASIYAAIALREKGHDVTVIDRQYEIGGLLLRGIPTFKLAKGDLPIVRKAMEASGIKFLLNTSLEAQGQGLTLTKLLANNHAVLLATGTDRVRPISHPDTSQPISGSEHIINALDFLYAHGDAVSRGIPLDSKHQVEGKRIAILGNGDTAADCIGETARQAGAREILVLQRSNKTTGSYKDKKLRFEEALDVGGGVKVLKEVFPLELVKHSQELILAYRNQDASVSQIPCDVIINAAGFLKPNLDEIFGIKATEHKNLFIAGDAKTGATLAVEAAQSGRDAARAMNAYLKLAL